jgi:hypothetical protein
MTTRIRPKLLRAALIGTILLLSAQGALAQFTQKGPKLVGTGAVGLADQGYSVSLSANGNTAIVGGFNDNSNTGAAWVFTQSNGVWTQQGSKLVGTGAVGPALQGYSVALSGDGNTAIVGGTDNSNATIPPRQTAEVLGENVDWPEEWRHDRRKRTQISRRRSLRSRPP